MNFNTAIKILLNENIDHLEEMARLPDHLRMQGVVDPNFNSEEVTSIIKKFFKEKPLGLFAKINNNKRDLDPSSIIIDSIRQVINDHSIDDDDTLKEALFNFHGHNNNVTKNKLAQKVWNNINEQLELEIPKTKIKQTLLQIKNFMKVNSGMFVTADTKSANISSRPSAAKKYKIIKNLSEPSIQEQISNQFDRHVARATRLLGQGEVLPISEIKSFFDTFEYNTGDIVKFLVDIGAIEPSDEIKTDEPEDKEEKTKDSDEVKDLEPDFFVKGGDDVSSFVDTTDIKGDSDFMSSNY